MQYNYDFEIASLLIMAVIFLHFIFIRQFPSDKTRIFGMLLLACIAESTFNILSCIGLANTTLVPETVNEALAFAFFVFEGLTSYLIFRYFMAVCDFVAHRRLVLCLGVVPFVIFSAMVLATPFIGFFYYFVDGNYYQGFGASFGYYYIAYYFLLDSAMLIARRRLVDLRTKIIMVIYTTVAVVMILIQYELRGLLLTSVSNALIVLMIYLSSMQNPREMIDSITGVGNENAFQLQLKNVLKHRSQVHVLTISLSKFQHIRTVLGVDNSNQLLRQVGEFLYRFSGNWHVFRTSNEAFSMLVETEKSQDVQQAIIERFAQDWEVQENHVMLHMVMLVQHYPDDFQTTSEFLGMKQFLSERAATAGSSAIIEMDEKLVEKYVRRTEVERAVLRAIRERSFEVYYQPIYSVQEKRIVSLEALVRLNDEKLGFIPPDEFIALAERDGNIVHIGEQVLEDACKFLSKHVLSNASLGIRTIQVNVSMVQCLRLNLTETIVPILEKYHIPPAMITLEITENTAVSTPERMRRHMKELGDMGIKFAMDDYGSGNSNCSYLIQFPFKEIKIDKEIVWASFQNPTAKMVLENEIRTIHSLGLPLVVEGIETKEQSDAMERLGVEYIQGYYYGKPLPEKECLRHIRQFNVVPENYAK